MGEQSGTAAGVGRSAAVELGAALCRGRLASGLSLRALARRLGMIGHSGLADYEKGRRIAPGDIVVACERIFGVPEGELRRLRERALAERAQARTEDWLAAVAPAGSAGSAPAAGLAGRVAQLPSDVPDFTGRSAELAELRAMASDRGPGRLAVLVLCGQPGVGKSALAVRFARQVADVTSDGWGFADCQLYAELSGAGERPRPPLDALAGFLRALGVPDARMPPGVEERAALYRSLLDGRRAVVLLDDAADEAQVRPLLPGAGCLAVVTSRRTLAGLAGARRLRVEVLSEAAAVELLADIVSPARAAAEPAATLRVARLCGQLPLAVRIAGNRLASWPGWPVSYLADRLADAQGRLSVLTAGDLAVRAAFSLSYASLSAAARRLFRRLSLLCGPDFTSEVAAALVGPNDPDVESLAEELAAASLLAPAARPGRYRLHDLLRLFARERLEQEESADERAAADLAATRRVVELAEAAGDALDPRAPDAPTRRRPCGDAVAAPARFASRDAALAWLDAERATVLATARHGAQIGADRELVRLADALPWYFDLRCLWREWRDSSELAVAAARRLGCPLALATTLNYLGLALFQLRCLVPALRCHREALAAARQAGDLVEEAVAQDRLGLALAALGRFAEATRRHRADLMLCQRMGERWGEASALNHLGQALTGWGRFAEAARCHEKASAINAELGDRRGGAMSDNALGMALAGLGRHEQAAACQRRASVVAAEVGDDWAVGWSLYGLGLTLRQMGDARGAAERLAAGLAAFEEVGDRYWQARTRQALGEALAALGDARAAAGHWRWALAVFAELGAAEASAVRRLLRDAD